MQGYPVLTSIPLNWGDQDALGHVNNTMYLRWSETARVDYLLRIGLWQMLAAEQVGPILASISCNYRRPLNYPDTVLVGARITRIGNSSMRMEHCIESLALGVVAAEVESTLVVMDYKTNKPIPVPQQIREAIARLEGWPGLTPPPNP
ncbi:MAG: acyl-CoA thioesterase [Bryobacteraceae bacterium]